MEKALDILACTPQEFANRAFAILNRGKIQALSLYKEWYYKGTFEGQDPCFYNAQALKHQIQQLTSLPSLVPMQVKQEGPTVKFTLLLEDRYETESVILPMQAGMTLCISSQVGCRMGCKFCETGHLGLIRQLTTHEIVRQLACAKHYFGARIRNIVFMGMGEPLDNIEAVAQAIKIFSDPLGFNICRRHITVSTSGHLEGLAAFMQLINPPVNLAVSVIAADDQTRTKLMPVNRRWNIAQLKQAMIEYCGFTKRQILIEYVLIEGINDKLQDAYQLAHYLQGVDAKVNLIPYNAQSPSAIKGAIEFKPPTLPVCQQFALALKEKGLRALLRIRLGHDIMAACGQLGNLEWRRSKAQAHSSLQQIK